jgi:sugar phosphate isomerase/epimerase
MQVDVGNALEGGADPFELVKKHPGRSATVHIKEFSKTNPKAPVGEGEVNWPELLKLLRTQGGTEWYIVEYEHESQPAIPAVGRCLANLRKMGK